MRPLEIGDVVRYATPFLKSIGAYTGDIPHARGRIVAISPIGETAIVEIEWEKGRADGIHANGHSKALAGNLEVKCSRRQVWINAQTGRQFHY